MYIRLDGKNQGIFQGGLKWSERVESLPSNVVVNGYETVKHIMSYIAGWVKVYAANITSEGFLKLVRHNLSKQLMRT